MSADAALKCQIGSASGANAIEIFELNIPQDGLWDKDVVASRCRPSRPASSSSASSSSSSLLASASSTSSSSVVAVSSSSSAEFSSSSPSASSSSHSSSLVSSSLSSSPSSVSSSLSSLIILSSSSSHISSSSPAPSSSSSPSSSSISSSSSAAPSAACTNVLADGYFTNGLTGWTFQDSGSGAQEATSCAPEYTTCAIISVQDNTSGVTITQDFSLVAGVDYTFNVDYLLTATSNLPTVASFLCYINYVGPTKRSLTPTGIHFGWTAHSDGSGTTFTSSSIDKRTSNPFTNYQSTFTGVTGELQLECTFSGTEPCEVSLGDVVIEPTRCQPFQE
ncbi:hypothetical protein SEUCBS139899_007994 [Sporothrix eucalyptigena]